MKDLPNVWMELCGSLNNSLGVEEIAELVGADRMVFGTDAIDPVGRSPHEAGCKRQSDDL